MKNLKIVIVDDEPSARKTLRLLINKISEKHEVIHEFESVSQAIAKLPTLNFDVLLLDIQLIDGTGFEILEANAHLNAKVIFTTAFDNYAIKAFRENAVDYLLKPINLDELKSALKKCNPETLANYNYQELLTTLKADLSDSKIAIKSTTETIFINTSEIVFIRADGSYSHIYLDDGRIQISTKPLKYYEDLLSNFKFFKINRQEIINNERISVFKKNIGHGQVIMNNGEQLNISRRRKVLFNNWVRDF